MTELQIHRFCLGDNENMTLRGRLALRTGPGKGPAPTITWGAEDADTWETRPCPPHSPTPGNALSPRDGRPRGHGVMSVAPSKRDREWACRPPGGRRAVRGDTLEQTCEGLSITPNARSLLFRLRHSWRESARHVGGPGFVLVPSLSSCPIRLGPFIATGVGAV